MLDHNPLRLSGRPGCINTITKIMFANLCIRICCIRICQQFFKQNHGAGKLFKQLLTFLCDFLCCDHKGHSGILKDKLDPVIRIIRGGYCKRTSGLQNSLSYCIKIAAALQYYPNDRLSLNPFFNERMGDFICSFIQLGIGKAFFTGCDRTFARVQTYLFLEQLRYRLKHKFKTGFLVNRRHFFPSLK